MIDLMEPGHYQIVVDKETKANTPHGLITLIPGWYWIVIEFREACGVKGKQFIVTTTRVM